MPAKLDRCVDDLKSKGGVDNPWAVCNASIGKETKEAVNKNRQVPFFDPKIIEGSTTPNKRKTTKGIGGADINAGSFLWKEIFDAQLKRNAK